MVKTILLKLADKDFFRLATLKGKTEMVTQESVTWEQFIMMLAKIKDK